MTQYTNHAAVSNQAYVQHFHGNVSFNDTQSTPKRSRYEADESDLHRSLDDSILASLAFPQMFDRRRNIESAHPQTCQWLLGLDEYRRWNDESRGLLWIKGKPGSGKSTLVAHLYRELWVRRRNPHDVHLEFFFSARGALLQRSFIGMLRSILSQIFSQDLNVRQSLRTTYLGRCASLGSGNATWEWTLPDLKRLLEDAILALAQQCQIVLLVDALDEAGTDTARQISSYFHSINDQIIKSAGAAKICISCRHYPIPSRVAAVEIWVEKHNRDDILLYVKNYIDSSTIIDAGQQCPKSITEALAGRADGVFQWISLVTPMVTKWLDEGETTEQILESLLKVPKDLGDVYKHILTNVVDSRYREKTLRLFQWVCLVRRPLSILELRYALSAEGIKTGGKIVQCHEVIGFQNSGSIMRQKIMTWSGGLLETMSRERSSCKDDEMIVQVIHQSVNDFMLTQGLPLLSAFNGGSSGIEIGSLPSDAPGHAVQMAHGILYLSCLKYLCTERPDESLSEVERTVQSQGNRWRIVNSRHPFLRYSARFGHIHAEKSLESRGIDLEHETTLLSQSFPTWIFAFDFWKYHLEFDDKPLIKTGITVLHFASIANLTNLANFSIKNGDDLNKRDWMGWTPMHIAASCGHLAMVTVLYENGADIQQVTVDGDTPLLLVAAKGHEQVFSFLLNCDANLNAANNHSEGVLYSAADQGNYAIGRLCIEAGVDVNTQGGLHGNALQAAAYRGNKEIVSLLLDAGASVNAQGGEYGNALQAAAIHGSKETTSLLLDAGASVNTQGGYYGNALQAAACIGSKGTVSLLLDADANVNAQGGCYGNALQAGALDGSKEIVNLLLDAGADVNVQGGYYGNALQAAASKGNKEIVRLLLDAGVDVNAQGGEYNNALQAAASDGDKEVVSLLLDAGADVNVQGGYYGNALQAGASDSSKEIVSLLLDAGADVNVQGGYYGNALQAAASNGKAGEEIVGLLLDAGANVNAQGGRYGSALSAAQQMGRTAVVDTLKAAGAEPLEPSAENDEVETSSSCSFEVEGDKNIEMTSADVNLAIDHTVVKGTRSMTFFEGSPHDGGNDDHDHDHDSAHATVSGGSWLLQMLSRFFP